jgi:2-methylisocitrate lyase-like PEP mutase family enzyme
LEEFGFNIVIFPFFPGAVASKAMENAYMILKEEGMTSKLIEENSLHTFKEFFDNVGMRELQEMEAKYLTDAYRLNKI